MKKLIIVFLISVASASCSSDDEGTQTVAPYDCALGIERINDARTAYEADVNIITCRQLRNALGDYIASECPQNLVYEQEFNQLNCNGGAD